MRTLGDFVAHGNFFEGHGKVLSFIWLSWTHTFID